MKHFPSKVKKVFQVAQLTLLLTFNLTRLTRHIFSHNMSLTMEKQTLIFQQVKWSIQVPTKRTEAYFSHLRYLSEGKGIELKAFSLNINYNTMSSVVVVYS
jgi:hypothetical protein